MSTFLYAFRSEWLKRKRSSATLLLLGASFFTPAVIAAVRLLHYRTLPRIYSESTFWLALWRDSWESMAVFFLPMTAILAASLITQIEFKSNAWKQAHTLPMNIGVLFVAKLGVIVLMMVLFLALFCLGVYGSGMIPYLLVPGVPHPKGTFLSLPFLRDSSHYFVDSLPMVGAQYLMGLRANNVLIPIGIGFMAWVGALAAISSKFAIWWPYSYTIINYLKDKPKGAALAAHSELHWLAFISFVLLTGAAYVLFVTRKEKG